MRLAVAALLSVAVAGCAARQAPPLDVTVLPCPGEFLAPTGDPISADDTDALLRKADYILIGEQHPSALDHNIQQQLIARLAALGRAPAVGLEMVAVDRQPVLDRFNAGDLPLADLPAALDWETAWGYPFRLYSGIFALAQAKGLPLAALNAPRSVLRQVHAAGVSSLTEAQRALYPAEVVDPPAEQRETLTNIFALHRKFLPDSPEAFLHAQAEWDSMMAEQAARLRAATHRPVVVLAGDGHVEHGWGIASRLRRLDPQARLLLVTGWPGGEWDAAAADLFFYSPPHFDGRMGMSLEERAAGVTVVRVQRGSRAATAGLRPGDILVRAQGRPVYALADLHEAGMRAHDRKQSLVFTVRRGDETVRIDLGPLGRGKR